jgi:hypothetical protein
VKPVAALVRTTARDYYGGEGERRGRRNSDPPGTRRINRVMRFGLHLVPPGAAAVGLAPAPRCSTSVSAAPRSRDLGAEPSASGQVVCLDASMGCWSRQEVRIPLVQAYAERLPAADELIR